MKKVTATFPIRKPVPSPLVAGATAALIETIRQALDGDGSWIEPGSIDSQGLTVITGVYRFRVELSEPELVDWLDHTPGEREDHDEMEEEADRRRVCDRIDRDWMADTGDDIAF